MSGLPTIFGFGASSGYSDSQWRNFLENVKVRYEMLTGSEKYKNGLKDFYRLKEEILED